MALYEEKYQLKGNELMNRLLEQVDAWKYVNKYKSKSNKGGILPPELNSENEQ